MDSDKRTDRIEDKLDIISDHLSRIDVTLAAQHESLKTHIKRTELLENRFTPIENHVMMVNAVAKIIGILVVAVGFLASVSEIIGLFVHKG